MKRLALAAALLLPLSGCESLYFAGVDSYSMTLPDGVVISVHSGKQEQSVNAKFEQTTAGYVVTLQENGIQAFQGQQIAASAASDATAAAAAAAVMALKTIK